MWLNPVTPTVITLPTSTRLQNAFVVSFACSQNLNTRMHEMYFMRFLENFCRVFYVLSTRIKMCNSVWLWNVFSTCYTLCMYTNSWWIQRFSNTCFPATVRYFSCVSYAFRVCCGLLLCFLERICTEHSEYTQESTEYAQPRIRWIRGKSVWHAPESRYKLYYA